VLFTLEFKMVSLSQKINSYYLYDLYVLVLLMQLGVDTVPVLIGPVSYLLLSKPAKGVEKGFPLLSLLSSILPVYK
jgi:hypothetical protein